MRPAPAKPPLARSSAPVPHGPHAHHAPPAGPHPAYDPEIGRLFAELRQYLGLSIPQAAVRLATGPNVIAALEAGRLDLLPPWSETARVVVTYVGMAGIDPRAVLDRIAARSAAAAATRVPGPVASAWPAQAVAARAAAEADSSVSRIVGRLARGAAARDAADLEPGALAQGLRTAFDAVCGLLASVRAVKAPVRRVLAGAVLLILVASAAPSGVLQASVNGLSSPISGLWRTLSGQFVQTPTRIREGHRWIEVDDPRSRRTDKLPSPRS